MWNWDLTRNARNATSWSSGVAKTQEHTKASSVVTTHSHPTVQLPAQQQHQSLVPDVQAHQPRLLMSLITSQQNELLERQSTIHSLNKKIEELTERIKRMQQNDSKPTVRDGELDLTKAFPSLDELTLQYMKLMANRREELIDKLIDKLDTHVPETEDKLERFFLTLIYCAEDMMHVRWANFQWQVVHVFQHGGSAELTKYDLKVREELGKLALPDADVEFVGKLLTQSHRQRYTRDMKQSLVSWVFPTLEYNVTYYNSLSFWKNQDFSKGTFKELFDFTLELLHFCWCCRISNPRVGFYWYDAGSPFLAESHKAVSLTASMIIKSTVYPALHIPSTIKDVAPTILAKALVRLQ